MKIYLAILSIWSLSTLSLVSAVTVTVIPETERQNFTEGVFWDYVTQVLLYVDKDFFEIHRLDVSTGNQQVIYLSQMPTWVIPSKDYKRRFITNQGSSMVYLFWPYDYEDGYYSLCLIAAVDYYFPRNKFNDARADACGRIWSGTYPKPNLNGTYPPNQASLYSIDITSPGKADVAVALRPLTFSNDLTWTSDNRVFYFTEYDAGCIFSFKYDLANGIICCGQPVFCVSDYNITGLPDGLAIDCNDNLWIAANGAGLVLNVNPRRRQLIRTVTIPASSVTDVAFGGPDLDILFVSTRNVGDPTDIHAGSIFKVTGLNVNGQLEHYAVMNSDCTPEFFI